MHLVGYITKKFVTMHGHTNVKVTFIDYTYRNLGAMYFLSKILKENKCMRVGPKVSGLNIF